MDPAGRLPEPLTLKQFQVANTVYTGGGAGRLNFKAALAALAAEPEMYPKGPPRKVAPHDV